MISIHAPRVGRDRCWSAQTSRPRHFNPRAPCGARRAAEGEAGQWNLFQSTRPVWGATDFARQITAENVISIHAPRVGRDVSAGRPSGTSPYFNPRAPCGARPSMPSLSSRAVKFQSTRPVWGATRGRHPSGRCPGHFNPRAPCGARLRALHHATPNAEFQSTRPVWGATTIEIEFAVRDDFNPRAPCGARLEHWFKQPKDTEDFNPRAPCGARRRHRRCCTRSSRFQSTRPVWGATRPRARRDRTRGISIHAPRVGRDGFGMPVAAISSSFQSTRPVWGATCFTVKLLSPEA